MSPVPSNRVRRFWSKVEKSDNGCWLWLGGKTHNGYGRFSIRRCAEERAHRFSWELEYGPVPVGMLVCHHCDVPACVNPAHLFVGTVMDNAQDRERKGRGIFGEHHHKAKLTCAAVVEIRRLRAARLPYTVIAPQFGITPEQAGNVARGKHWRSA